MIDVRSAAGVDVVVEDLGLLGQLADPVLHDVADADEPTMAPSRTTGMWRIRWVVMVAMSSSSVASGAHV